MLRAEDATLKRLAWLITALAVSVCACNSKDSDGSCAEGAEGCECYANHSCDSGLICSNSDLCVEDDDGGDSNGSGNDAGGSGGSGSSSGSGGAGGSSDSGGAGGSSSDDGDSSGSGGSATNDSGGASSTSAGGSTASTDGGAGGSGAGGASGGTAGSSSGGSGDSTSSTESSDTTSTTTTGGTGGTTGETRVDLIPVDGWVDGSTNDVGIQGSWYTFGDGVSTVVPASEPFFDGAGSTICISGSIPPHQNQDLTWGVAVAMDLNNAAAVSSAYDAPAHGVVGMQFTVAGTLPPRLQITVPTVDDATYCKRYESIAGTRTTLGTYFAELEQDCWEIDVSNPAPDPTQLRSFQIGVISSANDTVTFDFCVESVSAILE